MTIVTGSARKRATAMTPGTRSSSGTCSWSYTSLKSASFAGSTSIAALKRYGVWSGMEDPPWRALSLRTAVMTRGHARVVLVPSIAFRNATGAVLAAALLAGCVATPEYKDPLAALTQAPREGPYAQQSLRVILSENTQRATSYLESTAGTWRAWGSRPDFDARMLTDRLKDILERRFRSVTYLTNEAAPGQARADLSMVFDARVTLGSMSFTQNTVELAGIFTDEARAPVETVSGKG